MDKLEPLFKTLPIVLLAYGLVMTIGECFELSLAGNASAINADTEWQLRVFSYVAYLRAFDALFFYAAVAAAVHWLNVRNRGVAA